MDREQTTVSRIETRINLQNREIQDIILSSCRKWGPPELVEDIRRWLESRVGITTVTLCNFARDHRNDISNCIMYFGDFISQIPVHEVLKKLIKGEVEEADKDIIASDYLKVRLMDEEYKVDLEKVYKKWKDTRKYTVKRLKDIADELSKDEKNICLAKITGSTVSIVGVIGTTGAATLLSGGVALGAAMTVGTLVTAAGKTTKAGASAVSGILTRGAKATASRIVKEDRKNMDSFIKLLERYQEQTQTLMQISHKIGNVILRFKEFEKDSLTLTMAIGNCVEEDVAKVQSATRDSATIDLDGTKHTPTFIKIVTLAGCSIYGCIEASQTVVDSITIGAGITLSAAIIASDIYDIIGDAMKLADGAPNEAADKIRKAAMDLEHLVIPKLQDCIVAVKVGAVEPSQIQIIPGIQEKPRRPVLARQCRQKRKTREERNKREERERERKKKRTK